MLKTLAQIRVLLTPRDKWQLCGIALLLMFSALWEAAGIGLLLPVAAALIHPDFLSKIPCLQTFYIQTPMRFMLAASVIVVGNFFIKNLFLLWVIHVQSDFVYRKHYEWSNRLFGQLLGAEYAFFLTHPAAALHTCIGRIFLVCEGTLLPIMMFAGDALVALMLLAALVCFMPGPVLAAAAGLVILGGAVYFPLRRRNSRMGERLAQSEAELTAVRLAGLEGIKDVKAAGCEKSFLLAYQRHNRTYSGMLSALYQLGQVPRLGLEVLAVLIAMAIFCIMTASGMAASAITLSFAMLIAVLGRLLPTLSRMHYNLTRIRQVDAIFDNLYHDLTEIPPEEPVSDENQHYHLADKIEISDLNFRYREDTPIFRDFQLTIPARSSIALVGPTGGGKTTLADLILGLLKPDSGTIRADGIDIRRNLPAWRKITGYVPQFIYLANDTVEANVAFGVPPEAVDHTKVLRVLAMAHLDEVVRTLPSGVNTIIGDRGATLSGGQRQRLGIARALYREPELLILDEATSALDGETENAIVEALETLHGKLTTIVIAHRLETTKHCEKTVRIGAES